MLHFTATLSVLAVWAMSPLQAVAAETASESDAAAMLRARAAALHEAGQLEEALIRAQAAYLLDPTDAARLLLGRLQLGLKHCDEALRVLAALEPGQLPPAEQTPATGERTRILEACDTSPEELEAANALRTRATALLQQGQNDAANALVQKAQALYATDRGHLLAAKVQKALGRCDRARAFLKRVRPENLTAAERAEFTSTVKTLRDECAAAPPDMVLVPAGRFSMGAEGGEPDEVPVHEVYLPAFFIDRTEATVAQFRACVEAGACTRDQYQEASQKPYCNLGQSGRDDHPMNCVNWIGAQQFCQWAGKRLPTEAEWEKAARGPKGGVYPWGSAPPDCTRCIMDNRAARTPGQQGEGNDGCGEDRTWPVGSRPDGVSPYGVLDMAGNVWEWVADWYLPTAYADSPSERPTGPATGTRRAMRGGSWLSDGPPSLRATNRDSDEIAYIGNGVGLRCARDAE